MNKETVEIKIKYHSSVIDHIGRLEVGDMIDLRSAEHVSLKAGEFKLVSLGVSMKLPEGYEAHIYPRSSTFKKWGILMTNSVGCVDNSYSGDNDVWMMPVYATRDTEININDRICQFRIEKNQPDIRFIEVEHLDDKNRGGFGSTGAN